jgi:predicted exporter
VTTVVAYLALALTPFPGLRQMAVFSSVGLCFAWLTVVCWFPVLDRMPPRKSKLLDWYGRSRRVWPRLGRNSVSAVVVALTLVFCVIGVARLRTNDDIRLLQNSPQALIDEQLQVSKLLAAPGLAQFYLVRGATPEQVLQREEALKSRLDAMVAAGSLSGYQALSNWVPSQRTQTDNRALITHALLTSDGPLRKLATELDESRQWTQQVRARLAGADAGAAPLTLPAFLQSPASEPWRHLWLGKVDGGYASMVALRGVDARNLASLDATAHGLPGVQWVDKVGRISSLLGRYRQHMGLVVLGSYAMVFLLLYWRYRGQAWRALMPTLVASTLTLAVFGMTGQAINLFHVLALLLTLGMGVDYGILLQEHPDRQDKHAWMAVSMSAASTLLAFGLLGLSKTPALHAFGLTMLLAVGGACLIAPCFGSGNSNQEE